MAVGEVDERVESSAKSMHNGATKTDGDSPKIGVATGGHKRSLSGSILARLSFLTPAQEHENFSVSSLKKSFEEKLPNGSQSPVGAMASVVQQKKTRKRKGSLRKAALLGTKLRLEAKDGRASTVEQAKVSQSGEVNGQSSEGSPSPPSPDSPEDIPTPRNTHFPLSDSIPNYRNHTSTITDAVHDSSLPFGSLLRSPTFGDSSTTDEDDLMTLPTPAASSTITASLKKTPPAGTDSYFGPQSSSLRHRARPAKSPLAAIPIEPLPSPEEWDYSETEWWGWVVLAVTWIVFVIGMGSCFEVWSWAWDVGETPYAPPELEDDPTLPIVGYYPALIILTGVMAWVWVVVAWVGMKYFKHAKISGDEG